MGTKEQYEARKRAEDAKSDQKRWWFRQPNPIDRFTGWLVAWTALLFLGTLGSALVLIKTDLTLHETLVATQRPWLAINKIEPEGDLLIDPGGWMHLSLRFT